MSESAAPAAPDTTEHDGKAVESETPAQVKEMKSLVLTGFGGIKMLKVLQNPEPTVSETEVLIRVKAG
ncbi:hypothetical protein SNE40_013139 [Patella caerulea]